MQIDKVLKSGSVERFHATPGIAKQKISEHSWGVALIIQQICPDCSKDLLLAALVHDCVEMVTGDLPATFKWDNPEVRPFIEDYEKRVETEWGIHIELNHEEKRVLKLADCLEGMQYCVNRMKHGEVEAKSIFNKWFAFMSHNFLLNTEENEMVEYILIQYNEVI